MGVRLFLYHLGPGDQIQIVSLGGMHPYLLSHLTSTTQHPTYILFYISFTENMYVSMKCC